MSTPGGLTHVDDHISRNFPRKDIWSGSKMTHGGLSLGLGSEGAYGGIQFSPFTSMRDQRILGSFYRSTSIFPAADLDMLLCLGRGTTFPPHQIDSREMVQLGGLEELLGLHAHHVSMAEAITPAAETYAKSHGLYGALVLAKRIVHEFIPSMRALYVDLKKDPDQGGYPTVCFTISIKEPVAHVLDIDDALQNALYDGIPTEFLPYFSFAYQFE